MTRPTYQSLIEECVAYHGHLCLGQPLGVRLAAAGLGYLGLPLLPAPERRYRNLIVVVENDRCVADAVAVVTGARLGRKTLKLRDYGKQAATFCILGEEKGSSKAEAKGPARAVRMEQAVRVSISESLNDHIARYCQEKGWSAEDKESQVQAVLNLPAEDFLCLMPVSLEFPRGELPGRPERVVYCEACGERVTDGKDVERDGKTMCRSCAYGAYYTKLG